MKNPVQSILHSIEVGQASFLIRLIPLLVVVLGICARYDLHVYRGLNDAQSMDNAQLARQISRDQGFTTEFIRPYALSQLATHAIKGTGSGALFPADQFPPGVPRTLPDTYNAPGYPVALACWFKVIRPTFDQSPGVIAETKMYSGDRFIPEFNQIFVLITAVLTFFLALRLFDRRVAWMAAVSLLATDAVWKFSMTALSTNLLTLAVTAGLYVAVEILLVSEAHFESTTHPFWPAWLWTLLLAVILSATCLIRLDFLVLLLPLCLFFYTLPRANLFLFPVLAILVIGAVSPWFLYMSQTSGNALGSNQPMLLYGEGLFAGDQIFRELAIPNYEKLFKDVSVKQYSGFLWHMQHVWELLGSNPLILIFGASVLHLFRRRRAQFFRWLVIGSGLVLVIMNNLGNAQPDPAGPWNALIVLLPGVLIVGSAFFFVLLDRLNLQLWLVANAIIISTLLLTATPMALTLTSSDLKYYNYPPYSPPLLRYVGKLTRPDEWVTTDLPWATAWYGDRPSLWLPDSVSDFIQLNDNVAPTGIILLTPGTLSRPATNLTTGEDHEWFFLATGVSIPDSFPFKVSTGFGTGGPEYRIWSDRPRWQEGK